MREAVLTYKTVEEFASNVTFTASAGYTVQLPDVTPDDPNDILLGYTLTLHSDSDPVSSMYPYPVTDLAVTTQSFNGSYGNQYVVWSANSYSGSPGTYFLHITLTAVFAVTA